MKKRSIIFIVLFAILILLGFVLFSCLKPKDEDGSYVYSFSVTPTPYSLPVRSYKQTSFLENLISKFSTLLHGPNMLIESSNNDRNVGRTEHFILFTRGNDLDLSWFIAEIEQIYDYENSRLNTSLSEKIIIIFSTPESGFCAPRGVTYFDNQTMIFVFADQNTSKEQILATFAHELGHVFIHHIYPNLSDISLNEGMATWFAGKYWETWKGNSLGDEVRSFINEQSYLPLYLNQDMSQAYERSKDCLQNRDILLTEFASFIDFLIREYGIERLSSLYNIQQPETIGSQRFVYPPDYQGIYGLELNQIEQKWLHSIIE